MRVLLSLLAAGLAAWVLLCALVFFTQRRLIYYPQSFSGGVVLELGEARVGVTRYQAPGARAVLYFGGNAEDVSYSLDELKTAFPGQALYLMHYRGYGATPGTPTEAGLFADALALYEHVRATHPEVTLVGRSLGSGLAVRLAGMRPASRLVLVTPYDSMAGMAQRHYPWLPVRWLLLDKYESSTYAATVTAPTTIIVAEQDEVIPLASSEALHRSFPPGIASWHVVRGVGHNDISASPDYIRLLQTF